MININSKNLLLAGVLVLFFGSVAYLGFQLLGTRLQPTNSPKINAQQEASPIIQEGEVKTFEIEGKPYSFSINEIRVKKGDTVKIVFTNTQGFHDWVIEEFNARTNQTQAGQTETVLFVADKAGVFEYYCSVGDHRQKGMKGNLIVEEN